MQEFDLDKIWQESNEQAKMHYESVEGIIIEMAIRKSQNVLRKIVLVASWELGIGGGLMAIICAFFWQRPIIFWTSLICFSVLFAFALRQLIQLKSTIKKVNTYHIQKAIRQYILILEAHQKRINKYLIITTPLTFLAGMFSGIFSQDYPTSALIVNWHVIKWLIFSVAAISILIFSVRKFYLPWSLGRYIEELKELIKK